MKKYNDMLKFDIVDGFVGGGGGRRDDHIKSLIRILEIDQDTILGEYKKFAKSLQSTSFSTDYRALLWMEYLRKKNIVAIYKYDVPSVSYNSRDYYTKTFESKKDED